MSGQKNTKLIPPTPAATSSCARQSKRLVVVIAISAVVVMMILIAALRRTDRRQLMERTSLPPRDENTIEASVIIQRPVEKVFGFYRDFKNLPSFLGDVMAIEQIGPATSRWT